MELSLHPNRPEEAMAVMREVDTEIRFLLLDGELYMARNLLDSSFTPYATVVMMFDAEQVLRPLAELGGSGGVRVDIDDCSFRLDPRELRLAEKVLQLFLLRGDL